MPSRNIPTITIDTQDDRGNDITHTVTFMVGNRGQLRCNDIEAIDYYGDYRGGSQWIHEALEAWGNELGGYWDWESPESIYFEPDDETITFIKPD